MIPYKMSPKEWLHEIRYQARRFGSLFVRARHGVSAMDTWGFDHYMATVTAKGLRHLAEDAHGYPHWILEEFNLDGENFERALQCWKDWLIDKAKWFEWYAADELGTTATSSKAEIVAAIDRYDRKMETFKRVVLQDFAKHYDSLWD